VICEFFTWHKGFFKFELMDIQAIDAVRVDAQDFLLKVGLSPEVLVLEAARRADERGRQRSPDPEVVTPRNAAPAAAAPAASARPGAPLQARQDPPTRPLGHNGSLRELRSILQEIRAPNFTGEITLMIMRYAAKLVSRGIFFVMKSEGICGMGQFGLHGLGPNADERVRGIKIPADAPSVLTEVLERRQTYVGPLPKTPWNDRLIQDLGGFVPQCVLAVPMTVNEVIVALLYGDNAEDRQPIGNLEGLELVMNQAGLAMEKALLENKIKHFEARLAARP
jgi:hypothetical protein